MLLRASLAGLVYFAGVFALGFVLGTARVLVLEPTLGPLWPLFIELPVILAASWWFCRRVIQALKPGDNWEARLLMGVSAFAFLMAAELLLSTLVFGRTLMEHVSGWATAPGALGLIGQIAFASFPLVAGRRGVRA
jgi:hypothetical protein